MTRACTRCGGRHFWKGWWRGQSYVSCLACGYEPAPVHTDKRLEADMRAEVPHNPRSSRAIPKMRLTDADERALRTLMEARG